MEDDLTAALDELIKVWTWRGNDWPSPDFKQAAAELMGVLVEQRPKFSERKMFTPIDLDRQVKIAWNARGAADIKAACVYMDEITVFDTTNAIKALDR